MQRLWRALSRAPNLALPRTHMIDEVGDHAVSRLLALGMLQRTPLRDGDPYPCRCNAQPGCTMRVLGDPVTVAVCGLDMPQCEDVPLTAEDAVRLVFSPAALLALLARALDLRAPAMPPSGRALVALGEQRLGRERVAFYFVGQPGRARAWLSGGRGLHVLLTPHAQAIPADLLDRSDVEWIALADTLDLDANPPTLDLSELLLRRRFPGLVLGEALWPAVAIVVDEAQASVHYGGRPLPLERSPMAFRFMALLAAHPGRLVTRRQMMLELWPDDFTTRGNTRVDALVMDRRIRQLRSKVGGIFKALGPVAGLPVDPVENLRARSDVEGGYRLGVGRVVAIR